MSAVLLDAVLAQVRSLFTPAEGVSVQEYGGEFDAAEIDQVSFAAPAVFIAVLGWRPADGKSQRLTGRYVRQYRMAAFVATKHARREQRMRHAMQIAERLAVGLRIWSPVGSDVLEIGALEDDPAAENLYNRAGDKRGMALWMVDWRQCAKPLVQPTTPEQLYDLVEIDITDTTQPGAVPTAAAPSTAQLVVRETVLFEGPEGA